jgi:thymidine phosphorylase
MSYRQEYDRAAKEMKAALADLQTAESRVLALQRRMAALVVLMAEENPDAATKHDVDVSLRILRATKKPAEHIRRIFETNDGPLTIKDIREKLKQTTCDISEQANPSGLINALCARLVQQGVIRRTQKAGRNAWEKTKL